MDLVLKRMENGGEDGTFLARNRDGEKSSKKRFPTCKKPTSPALGSP